MVMPTNLPRPLTSFVGREREAQHVRALLHQDSVRLLTLTGPGGTGKTRLAVFVAASILHSFPDGVAFVALAPIADPDLVIPTIAHSLGIEERGDRPVSETLGDYLRGRRLLLVLDNFEHILAAAPRLADLLAAAEDVRLLVTSRALLGLSAEHAYSVPPLSLPPVRAHSAGGESQLSEAATRSEAVQLFLARARAANPDYAVNDDSMVAIAAICRRLDGLPLAIELAAARSRLLPSQALLARLERRLPLLAGGMHDVPARHQALRQALAWSYALLDVAEQALFRQLSVFVGGCTVEAAERVAGAGAISTAQSRPSVLNRLQSLHDKSLLHLEDAEGELRLTMLATIREYAEEQLRLSGDAATVQLRHARYFVALAEEAEPALRGAEQARWVARLVREHDNLRAALAFTQGGNHQELGLRIGAALWRFWFVRGALSEGRGWLERALTAECSTHEVRARALTGAGALAWSQADYSAARQHHEEALRLRQALGDTAGIAMSLHSLGNVAVLQGDRVAARALYTESLSLKLAIGDRWGAAQSLSNLGKVAGDEGDYATGQRMHEEALALQREIGDTAGIALTLCNLAEVLSAQRDHATARSALEESLALWRALSDNRGLAHSLHQLGVVAFRQGDYAAAHAWYIECLDCSGHVGSRSIIADGLEGVAGVAAALGHAARAAHLFGAAKALRERIGAPITPSDRRHHEQVLAGPRALLGDGGFRAALTLGQALSPEEAIALAREALPPPAVDLPRVALETPWSAPGATDSAPDKLTDRELQVLQLVAQALSNRAIADRLGLSTYTIQAHLRSIFGKIGVASRSAATRYALDHHLAAPDPGQV